MTIEIDTITMPAYWACYLINGDAIGLEDEEIAHCDAYVEKYISVDGWYVVSDVEDSERFTNYYYIYGGTCRGGTVVDYTIHREAR